ncbi:MAG: phosphate ABC transporter permease subunit PstC [Anaerolineae bacterium]|nr:phosphate ABC transporter permease subunit PstC [Anaerolineae bacterium]MDW8067986.1 phosphate ABC transporter permease subunit PstC [Anaerolineae bacterium]
MAGITTLQERVAVPKVLSQPALTRRRKVEERIVKSGLFLFATVSILTTLGIIFVLFQETVFFFQKVSFAQFFLDTRWTPLFLSKRFGIWPLVNGTMLVAAGAMVIALPLGLLAAIFMSEVANERIRRILKPFLEILAGVPTVVYGYFALTFITPILRSIFPQTQVFNAASAAIAMGFMILPTVASLSEDALYAVPRSLREAAYALGATRWEVATQVVVPAAFSGIAAAFILAVSRAVGETMIVAIAAGQQPKLTLNPLESIETMTAYIVQVSLGDTPHGTLEYQTIFAVGMMLFLMTLGMNVASYLLTRRFREVYE